MNNEKNLNNLSNDKVDGEKIKGGHGHMPPQGGPGAPTPNLPGMDTNMGSGAPTPHLPTDDQNYAQDMVPPNPNSQTGPGAPNDPTAPAR